MRQLIILVCLIMILTLPGPFTGVETVYPQAAPTITFEETIPLPNTVVTQYCNSESRNMGVEFLNPVRIIEPSIGTSSGSHAATNFSPGVEFGEFGGLKIRFTTFQKEVSLKVGLDRAYHESITAFLTAYSGEDAKTGFVEQTWIDLGNGPTPITHEMSIYDGAGHIRSIELKFKGPGYYEAYEWLDDLSFSTIGGMCIIDSSPPHVTILNPASDNANVHSQSIQLEYEATDDVSGIARIQVQFLDQNHQDLGAFYSCGGLYNLSCYYAIDPIKLHDSYWTHLPANTSVIRVTAWDFTDRQGSADRLINLGLPSAQTNIWLMGIEITQGIQPWVATSNQTVRSEEKLIHFDQNTATPLVTGKRTVVRVYPGIESSGGIPVVNATAYLSCTDNNGKECPGSLLPSSTGITIDPADNNNLETLRGDASKSWNFTLPDEWTEWGRPLKLTAGIRAQYECDACYDGANWMTVDWVEFNQTAPLKLHLVWACVRRQSGDTDCEETDRDIYKDVFQDLDSAFVQTYPVASQNIHITFHAPRSLTIDGDFKNNGVMSSARMSAWHDDVCGLLHHDISGTPPANLVYFGIVPNPVGAYLGLSDGHCAVGKIGNDPAGDILSIVAHEIGHSLGRKHASCDHDEGGCEPAPDTFPCEHGGICTYGFNAGTMEAISPGTPPSGSHTHDFMSYGDAPLWVSPYTYQGLYEVFHNAPMVTNDSKVVLASFQPPATQDVLLVQGIIRWEQNSELPTVAELLPTYHYPDTVDLAGPGRGRFSLELHDADGNLLYTLLFEPDVINIDPPPTDTETVTHFSQVLPYSDQVAQVTLKYGNLELARRERSSNSPEVQLFSPYDNTHWGTSGTEYISWEAQDADGDDLFFTVQYSVDAGRTWSAVATDLTGTSIKVESGDFPGTTEAMVRVLASDGLNTAIATSDLFSVDNKAPIIWITSPSNDIPLEFEEWSLIILEGNGTDLEDGALDTSAFEWWSNRDGQLGTGRRVDVTTLSPGTHEIGLKAKDSHAKISWEHIVIRITERINTQPIADAGPDQVGTVGSYVVLDGSSSQDEDDDPLTFHWAVLEGPYRSDPQFTPRATGPYIGFTSNRAGHYVIGLVVDDGQVSSLTDTVSVDLREE